MKRKEVGEAVITHVDYPNKGRFLMPATVQNPANGKMEDIIQRGTVKNTIPGQKVQFRVFKKHGERIEGHLLKVLEKSPLETREKACDIFGVCGGCLYQTMPYEEQLKMKAEQVCKLFEDIVDEDTIFDGIKASPKEWGYRNKMEVSFGNEYIGGPLTLGMHRRNSRYDVLPAGSCAIVDEDLRVILLAVQKYCEEQELPFYNKGPHIGYLRFLLMRRSESTGEIMVVLVTSSQMEHDFGPLKERLLELSIKGEIIGIYHAIDDGFGDKLQAEKMIPLYGRDYFTETLLGLTFKVTAFSFFQTNTLGAEVLYDTTRQYVTAHMDGDSAEKPVIYDLYSGTGTIGQLLAPVAGKVYGIEIIPEAVESAKENAALNGIKNCEFIQGDVLEKLAEIKERPDYLVLDPPREGINPKALSQIMGYDVDHMVYISCKSSSFVKNMIQMKEYGWRIERYTLVDMFPETQHVETIALLNRIK